MVVVVVVVVVVTIVVAVAVALAAAVVVLLLLLLFCCCCWCCCCSVVALPCCCLNKWQHLLASDSFDAFATVIHVFDDAAGSCKCLFSREQVIPSHVCSGNYQFKVSWLITNYREVCQQHVRSQCFCRFCRFCRCCCWRCQSLLTYLTTISTAYR